MKRTGEILKQARENNGLSLHEIGLHIKINNKTLKAIEDGDTGKLPAKTFLRGFVRSYATFLKLNVDEVMVVFQEEMGSTKPAMPVHSPKAANQRTDSGALTSSSSSQNITQQSNSQQIDKQQENNTRGIVPQNSGASLENSSNVSLNLNLPTQESLENSQELATSSEQNKLQGDLVYKIEKKRNALAMTVAGIAVALVLVIVGINKIIEKYTKETELNQVTIQEPIDQSEVTQQAAEATTENISADQAAVEQNKNQSADTNVMTTSVQAPVIAIDNKPKEMLEIQKTTPANVNQVQTSTTTSAVEANNLTIEKKIETDRNKPVELIVEAASDVEIQYATQSGKIEVVKLKADQVHTFKSKQGLKVSISDAGAVNLILNGRDIGTPGGKGKQVKLSY